jgi:3-oxoacyl-[acyl-carrier protein] reductase
MTQTAMRFGGHTAVVTGAGSGIGYAIVRRFAVEGAHVLLNDVDAGLAARAAAAINEAGGEGRVAPFPGDVSDVALVRAMVADAVGRTGRIDHVIANAGLTQFGSFLDYSPEAFERVVGINLRGTFFLAQAGARAMVERKAGGRIVLLSSVNGLRALPRLPAYAMTKAGIVQMAKSLAAELGRFGINVNAVAPGATLTERTRLEDPDYERNFASVNPLGAVATPEDIADVVAFLCAPESRHVSGQTIVVDGGWTNTCPVPARFT